MNTRPTFLAPLALALALGSAAAQPAVPVVYVSNFTGGQVLAVNTTTGATAVVLSRTLIANGAFSPQDMVIGPDANLYICDSLNGLVWRYVVGQPVATSGPSMNPVVVADFTGFSPPVYPEGPSFSGSDDLYVNSRGAGTAAVGGTGAQGVWAIPDAAATPTPQLPIDPQLIEQVLPPFGAAGEGTTFAVPGHLLAVDRAGNKVIASKPIPGPFPQYGPSYTQLITSNLSAPVGISTNTCGDALVSSGTAIQRFGLVKDTTTGELSAQFLNAYVTFPSGDVVTFFERDAANVLWVNTNNATAGGKVWKIVSSCTSGVRPSSPLVALKSLSQGRNAILSPNSQLQAVGLAIPASDYTPAAKTFSPANPSQTWDFGHYSLRLEYKQVLTTFTQSFTSLMSRPADITFASGTFEPGTVGTRYPSLGGSVIQFRTLDLPVAGTDFEASTPGAPAFRLVLFSGNPIQGFTTPGVAHASDNSVAGVYIDDYTSDFWVGLADPRGATGNTFGSKYVAFDGPLQPGLAMPLTVTLTQPALSGNPLFNFGQNFPVSITVRDANGATVPGLTIRLSVLRFSPLPFVLETVVATNTPSNLLSDNGNGRYSIGVQTGLFQGGTGTYQFTLSGDGFPPFVFYALFEK